MNSATLRRINRTVKSKKLSSDRGKNITVEKPNLVARISPMTAEQRGETVATRVAVERIEKNFRSLYKDRWETDPAP